MHTRRNADEFTMTEQTNLDQRPRLPYSIGTGIPKQGQAEIEGYLQSLRLQGLCVIERVIPQDEVAAARDNLLRGRQLLLGAPPTHRVGAPEESPGWD